MAFSPVSAANSAQLVAEIYRDAELRILNSITDSLKQGIDGDGWERLQLARLQQASAVAVRELTSANAEAGEVILSQLRAAYASGDASALADVGEALDPVHASTIQQQATVRALAKSTTEALASAQQGILRAVPDVYQSIVAEATAKVATGTVERPVAVQEAVGQFLSKGLTGIQTARGTMDISTYAVMAVRTATVRSVLQGHIDTMSANGLNFVTIQPGPRDCDICDSWAGKILSTDGSPAGTYTVPDLSGDGFVDVECDGSLDDARDDGWGHPNCRCNISAYLPGVSESSTDRPPWDEDGYDAQQQQRANERDIRSAKVDAATAITPEAQAAAQSAVADAQQAQRDLLAQHDYLKRQSSREQIGTGKA